MTLLISEAALARAFAITSRFDAQFGNGVQHPGLRRSVKEASCLKLELAVKHRNFDDLYDAQDRRCHR
jgi:hypothetical protein